MVSMTFSLISRVEIIQTIKKHLVSQMRSPRDEKSPACVTNLIFSQFSVSISLIFFITIPIIDEERKEKEMFHLMLALIIMFVTNHHFLLDRLFHTESYTMNWMNITSMRSITPHFSARKPQQNNNKLVPIYHKKF